MEAKRKFIAPMPIERRCQFSRQAVVRWTQRRRRINVVMVLMVSHCSAENRQRSAPPYDSHANLIILLQTLQRTYLQVTMALLGERRWGRSLLQFGRCDG